MSTASEMATAWFENVWNQQDGSYIEKMLDQNCNIAGLDGQNMTRSWQFDEFYTKFNIAFTAVGTCIEQLMESGDRVCGLITFSAKHRKSGIKASFKVSFHAKVSNGKFVDVVNVVDYVSLMSQLNLIEKEFVEESLYK